MSGVRPSYDDRFAAPLEANRRGAHRARPNPVLGFLPIVAVMALVGIVAGGAFALLGGGSLLPGGNSPSGSVAGASPLPTTTTPRPSATATTPTVTATAPASSATGTATPTQPSGGGGTVTKSIRLTVLNATKPAVNGLAAKVKSKLQADGWTVSKTGTQGSSSPPTTVFYATADLRATANALVKELGVGLVQQNPAQAGTSGITIVIGNDYQR
jgi:hypothetical protein